MGNIVLSNTQHEEFVLEYLFGDAKGNAAQSYANVYYNGSMAPSCYSSASKLLTRPEIQGYIESKMEEQKKIAEYRKIHNNQILSDIIGEMSTAQPVDHNGNPISAHLCRQTAIKAIVEQNKMLGLNEEKTNINVDGGMNFTFNLVAPEDNDDFNEVDLSDIRSENGDTTEDIDFEELDND